MSVGCKPSLRLPSPQTPHDQVTIARARHSLVVVQNGGNFGFGVESDGLGRLRLLKVKDDVVCIAVKSVLSTSDDKTIVWRDFEKTE